MQKHIGKLIRLLIAVKRPRFAIIKVRTKGMLSPAIYEKIYNETKSLPDYDIIEVGAALGASSISIALALKDTNKNSNVIVIEKCEGGTRVDVGNYNDNYKVLTDNLCKFKIDNKVKLFPHELTINDAEKINKMISTPRLAALFHDADGRIDRDFFLFWEKLIDGGLIVIDDYEKDGKYLKISDKYPYGGMKCVTTFRLVNQFVDWGLIKITQILGNTVFGVKPLGADFSRFNLDTCQAIVDSVEQDRKKRLGLP